MKMLAGCSIFLMLSAAAGENMGRELAGSPKKPILVDVQIDKIVPENDRFTVFTGVAYYSFPSTIQFSHIKIINGPAFDKIWFMNWGVGDPPVHLVEHLPLGSIIPYHRYLLAVDLHGRDMDFPIHHSAIKAILPLSNQLGIELKEPSMEEVVEAVFRGKEPPPPPVAPPTVWDGWEVKPKADAEKEVAALKEEFTRKETGLAAVLSRLGKPTRTTVPGGDLSRPIFRYSFPDRAANAKVPEVEDQHWESVSMHFRTVDVSFENGRVKDVVLGASTINSFWPRIELPLDIPAK